MGATAILLGPWPKNKTTQGTSEEKALYAQLPVTSGLAREEVASVTLWLTLELSTGQVLWCLT